ADRAQRSPGDDRGVRAPPDAPARRLRRGHGLPVQLHGRAGPGHRQVPVRGRVGPQLLALQGPRAGRPVRQAVTRARPRGAQAVPARVREAAARRGGPLLLHAAEPPDHPAQRQGAGLDDHAEPLPEPAARHGLARRITRRGVWGALLGPPSTQSRKFGMTSLANYSIDRRILSCGSPPKFIQHSTWPTPASRIASILPATVSGEPKATVSPTRSS